MHAVAQKAISELQKLLEDTVPRAESERLLKAAQDQTDHYARMLQDDEKKTKAAQDVCTDMRVQLDEDQVIKQ